VDLREVVDLLSDLEVRIGQPIKPYVQSKGLSALVDYAHLVKRAEALGVPNKDIQSFLTATLSLTQEQTPPTISVIALPASVEETPTDSVVEAASAEVASSAHSAALKFLSRVKTLAHHLGVEEVKLSTRDLCLVLGLNPKENMRRVHNFFSEYLVSESGSDPCRYTRGRVSVFTFSCPLGEKDPPFPWKNYEETLNNFCRENPPRKPTGLSMPSSLMDFLDGTDDEWALRDEDHGLVVRVHVRQSTYQHFRDVTKGLYEALTGSRAMSNAILSDDPLLDRFVLERSLAIAFPAVSLRDLVLSVAPNSDLPNVVEAVRARLRATQVSPDMFSNTTYNLDTSYAGRVYLVAVMYAYYLTNT